MSASGVRHRKSTRQDDSNVGDKQRITEDVQPGAGWGTLCTLCVAIILGVPIVLVASLTFMVESPINAVPNILPEPPEWTGALEPVPALLEADRMFDGKLFGPESMVVDKDYIYTGTMDGKILAINKWQMKAITHLGQMPCGGYDNEPTCGRPLGMRMDKDGYLIVLDTYLGIFKINVATGDHHMILPPTVEIGGKKPMFLNDLDISSDGTTIYMTDSSTKYQRRQFPLCVMEPCSDGRFIKYNLQSNTTEVLLDGLHFPNGVQLSKSGDYVLIVETTTASVTKYHLTGEKKGTNEVFIDNLPCFPDNIRRRKRGGFWIGCNVCRRAGHFSMIDYLGDKPAIRNFLAKIPTRLLLMIGPPDCGMIIHVNEQGQIEKMYNDPTNKNIIGVSEVEDDHGVLYLGSYKAPYLGKVDLNKLKEYH